MAGQDTSAASEPYGTVPKRKRGRPFVGGNDVGREGLLVATENLLQTMPPARVTIARIAEEAKVHPALVRYHFGSRSALLVAVVDRVTAHATLSTDQGVEPTADLADHIGRTVDFIRSAPFMHRLMLDEMVQDGTEETRARVREMNLDLVALYRNLLRADGGNEFVDIDPLLLHLAVLGASDFFSSAEPIIRELLPVGTDPEKLTADFKVFLTSLIMNGLRKR